MKLCYQNGTEIIQIVPESLLKSLKIVCRYIKELKEKEAEVEEVALETDLIEVSILLITIPKKINIQL